MQLELGNNIRQLRRRDKRTQEQLAEYLAFHNLKTGYMLTFNFNQKKEIGIKEVAYGDKILIEAVV